MTRTTPADWPASQNWTDPVTGVTWTATRTGAQTGSLTADSLAPYAALPIGERMRATLQFVTATATRVRVSLIIAGGVELVQSFDPSDAAAQLAGDLSIWTVDDGSPGGVEYARVVGASPSRVAGALGDARMRLSDADGLIADIDGDVTPSVWIARVAQEETGRVLRVSHATLGSIEVPIPADVGRLRCYWGVSLDGSEQHIGVTDVAGVWTEATAALVGYTPENIGRIEIGASYARAPGSTIGLRGVGFVASLGFDVATGAVLIYEAKLYPRADLSRVALRTAANLMPAPLGDIAISATAVVRGIGQAFAVNPSSYLPGGRTV